jgi:lipoprotein NlpD
LNAAASARAGGRLEGAVGRVQGSGRRACALACVTMLAIAGCSATREPEIDGPGVFYEVRSGENLYRIGKAYGVSHRELARINHIANPDRLEIGQRVFIPGGKRTLPVDLITPRRAAIEAPEARDFPRGQGIFVWPLSSGTLTSSFGPRGDSFHDGIDIGAPSGTPVRAAREGTVIYSDTLRGYGNVVIVEHTGGYATVYAHNDQNLVRAGDRVRQGQQISRVGRSGRTSGPNLHFEVRKDNVARNPIYFLPTQTAERARNSRT